MAQLAIKGHSTRSKEVLELLKMMGGKNFDYFTCDYPNKFYYVLDGYIHWDYIDPEEIKYVIFTLEEFLEKYPYKVGDKVEYIKYDNEHPDAYTICNMKWTGNTIEYTLDSFGLTCLAKDIQLYKKETIENKSDLLQQLKDYFDNTPREVIEKEWHEYDKYNKIGPTVNEYLEYINNIRHPKYPKTYAECHELMVQWKEYDCNPNSELILCEAPIHDFCKLIVARNIYWKIAGEQMELGKPWEPDWTNNYQKKWTINFYQGEINLTSGPNVHFVLAFPTEEMRDAFYENFKDLVETCKEFL